MRDMVNKPEFEKLRKECEALQNELWEHCEQIAIHLMAAKGAYADLRHCYSELEKNWGFISNHKFPNAMKKLDELESRIETMKLFEME